MFTLMCISGIVMFKYNLKVSPVLLAVGCRFFHFADVSAANIGIGSRVFG